MRRLPWLIVVPLCLAAVAVTAKPKRDQAGPFIVRKPHPLAEIERDHPSLVAAREALWAGWKAARRAAVTLEWEWGDQDAKREDAVVEISRDRSRRILLRVEDWSRSSGVGHPISEGVTRTHDPRSFAGLERIPLDGEARTAAALPGEDTTDATHWRLRFVGDGPIHVW